MPPQSPQQIRIPNHEAEKGGGLLPQKNLSRFTFHPGRYFLFAVP